MKDIIAEVERWKQEVRAPSVARFKERKPQFSTLSGIPVEGIFSPADIPGDYIGKLGMPGCYPFTRGVQPTMYRARHWTMRQYAGFGDAATTSKRFKYLLEQGQTGLSVAFDLPTQMGYDSDHPLARGEVGKVGVAIDTVEDMDRLMDSIPLDRVSTSMTINSTAPILLAMYIALARARGVDPGSLRGTVQNDILKEYVARGTYIFPPRPSMRLVCDLFAYCGERLPRWNTISISGYHIREAGSTAVQEVAFTLADGIAYVEAALKAGLTVDRFARRLSFFFNVHNNFLEEVAKFRAARRLWARIMKERFGATDEGAMRLRFHTQTAGGTLAAKEIDNNVVRVTLQALAAVLGGTQSLHTNSRDEALGLPTEESVLVALRTQQVIGYESGLADFVDPLGGSYAIESLTDQIESRCEDYIRKIDEMGGMVTAIEKGYVQSEIEESAYTYQLGVESGDIKVLGVNFMHKEGAATDVPITRIDPAVERGQKSRLAGIKESRDRAQVDRALAAVVQAARGETNMMVPIVDAVEARATVGEISDAMREVFGEFRTG